MKRQRDQDPEEGGLAKKKSAKEIPNPFNYNINPYIVNSYGQKGETLLYASIKNDIHVNGGYYKKVEYLVEVMGADIDKGKDKGNKSPLYKAIFEGTIHPDFVKIAKFLIDKGAKNDYVGDITPLHLAAISCSVPVLEAFANNGYDFTLKARDTRDVTVITLIIGSRASKKDMQEALAAIPVEQLPVIWSETIVDPLLLGLEEKEVLDDFIELNTLTPLSRVANLGKESITVAPQDVLDNHEFLSSNFTSEKLEEKPVPNMFSIEAEKVLRPFEISDHENHSDTHLTGEGGDQN